MLKSAFIAVLLAAAMAPRSSRGEVMVEGAPRFQVLEDRERVIVPLSERALGAVVKPARGGTAEVILVQAGAPAAVMGRRFRPTGRRHGGPLVRGLSFRPRSNGDLAVAIDLTDRAARADARLTDAPPALVVDVVARRVPHLERAARRLEKVHSTDRAAAEPQAGSAATRTPVSGTEPGAGPTAVEPHEEDATADAAAGDRAAGDSAETVSQAEERVARSAFVTINGAAFLWPALDAPYFRAPGLAPWVEALRAWRDGHVREARSHLAELLARLPGRGEAPPGVPGATAARLLLEADARYLLVAARGSRNLREAAIAYARAYRADPAFPEAWRATLLRGYAYAAMRLFPEAEAAFREIELNRESPGAIWARLGRAGVLVARGDLDEAQPLLEALTQERHLVVACHARLALAGVLGLRRRWRSAIEILDDGLAACPKEVADVPEARIRRAEVLLGAREAAAAEQSLAGLDDDNLEDLVAARVLLVRGRIAEARGDTDRARQRYREAATLAPGGETGQRAAVAAAMLSTDPSEARATLARMARAGSTPEVRTAALIGLARVLEGSGDHGAAAAALARAAGLGGGRAARERVRDEQAAMFGRQVARAASVGRHAEVVRAYAQAQRGGAELDDRTRLQVARSYLALSLVGEAVPLLSRLRKAPARDIRGEALSLLARIMLDRGQPAEALDYARAAEEVGASGAKALLAEALIGLGHLGRANDALGDVAGGGEDAEAGALTLARAYLEQGEGERARAVLAPLLAGAEERSHGAQILELEARAARAAGDCVEALAVIRRLQAAFGGQAVGGSLGFMAGQCHESMGDLAAARAAYANAAAAASDVLTRRAAAAAVEFVDLLRAAAAGEREESS